MVGPFGGVTAAQALAGVLKHPQRLGEPVALTINFAAAIADGAFDLIVRPVRTNRSDAALDDRAAPGRRGRADRHGVHRAAARQLGP